MKQKLYSTLFVARVLNMDRERFRAWTLKKFFRPTQKAKGKGTKAGFTITDIYGIALFKMLVEEGLKREIVAKLVGNNIGTMEGGFIGIANYFMVGRIERDGEVEYIPRTFIDHNPEQKLSIDFFPEKLEYMNMPSALIGNWQSMRVYNLLDLRKRVEIAIAKEEAKAQKK